MKFGILGPLEVVEDGRQVDVGGAKQRTLLAVLLLEANRVVSTDRLIDALWDESPPTQPRKTLQVYVSQLRKAIGSDRIETRSPGYLLRVADDELDLQRFQRLAAQGEHREALALFRGRPLADFESEAFASVEAARLEELRLACIEDRIEADLAAGRHGALVGELESLVREQPLRERLRGQMMLALYRSGRQAEALEAFQAARRTLVDELGIEPSRGLRDLHQAILRQDAALDLPVDAEPDPTRQQEPPRKAIAESERTVRAERKTVTVVHVRIAVSGEHGSRLDPELLSRIVTQALRETAAAIEAHEGTIDSTTSDSLSAVFGLPVVHEDDALRAVRAAEDVHERLARLALEIESSARLEARIGASTGQVMTGGSASPLMATGEPLTRAAQLAQDAEPAETALDEATRRALASRRDASRFASPMVGRSRERRRLHDAFEQAVGDRSCQLFTLLGAAGVGKSRLVQEFLEDVGERAVFARGRCLPYGEGITFWPVLEAIRDVAGLDDAVTPEAARARIAALIEGHGKDETLAQQVIELIGLSESTASVEEGFRAVRMLFEGIAANRPLVVVFDDIHWAEGTFLELVEQLAEWSRGAPILLLCMARPELLDLRSSWSGGKLNATSVLLEPLSDDECEQLVVNLVGETTIDDAVRHRIAEAAEGNPLFVEEVLSMLIDEGILVRANGGWTAATDLTSFPVPPTIQALLAARLDQLTPEERAALEPAAVEGKVFHESFVGAAVPGGVAVPEALAALVRKELIRPERAIFLGERAFRFRHLMIRDAVYDAITKEARASLHAQHVEWLDARTSERSVEFDEIGGYHLEQAVRYRAELGETDQTNRELGRQAAERLGAAGRRAFARSDAPGGVNLVSRAVGLLSPDDPLRVELVPNVRVIQGLSDLRWADRVLTEAVEAAATTGDRRLAAHALVQRGLLRLFTEPDVTARELFDAAERAIAVFEEHGDELGLARAWRLVAQAHYLDRSCAACADASERALTHAQAAADRFEMREIIEWLVIALLLGPAHGADAIAHCERLLEEAAGDPHLEAQILGALAPLLEMQGRTAETDAAMARGRRLMEETGEPIWVVSFWRAMVHLWRDDAVTAEEELRPSYEALKRIGEKSHFSSLAHGLANALYMQGRYDETEQLTHECEDACRPNDVHSHILWRSTRAKVLARRGELKAALQLARDAVEIAEESDFLPARAGALEDLAKVLYMADGADEARPALQAAIDQYEQKGNLLAVDRARRVLAERADR
jgi:DNA-binding SARP family transcriptional activator/tetratricopeptide (TPR) repeat protein